MTSAMQRSGLGSSLTMGASAQDGERCRSGHLAWHRTALASAGCLPDEWPGFFDGSGVFMQHIMNS